MDKQIICEEAIIATKQCRRKVCGKSKPLSEFYKNKCKKDGYSHWCKECMNWILSLPRQVEIYNAKNTEQKTILGRSIIPSFPLDEFLELKLINRPHPPVTEYFLGRKIKNPYFVPENEGGNDYEVMYEFAHGEPDSSYKDFIILNLQL